MLKTDKIIVVEGSHDADALAKIIDATIITTNGFGIFNDKKLAEMLRSIAQKRTIIILTDSDRAGFDIRNYLVNIIGKEYVKHVYIPDIYGKERRKKHASKEGKLGVEGMSAEVLEQAFINAGICSDEGVHQEFLSKSDFYDAGLSGGQNSSYMRDKIKTYLNLPHNLSANKLIDVLNIIMNKEKFSTMMQKISGDK